MDTPTSALTVAAFAATLALLSIAPAYAAHGNPPRNDTVEGYTATGDTVYRDGRVVTPNGSSFYPKDQRQSIACRNGSCGIYDSRRGYDGERPAPHDDEPSRADHGPNRRT